MKSLTLGFTTNSSSVCKVIIFQKKSSSNLKDVDFYFKKHFEETLNSWKQEGCINKELRNELESSIRKTLSSFIDVIQKSSSDIIYVRQQSDYFDINNQFSSQLTELGPDEIEMLTEALEEMLCDAGYIKKLTITSDDWPNIEQHD